MMKKKTPVNATFSLSELGRFIGVSAQSMSKYAKLGGFPRATDGDRWAAMPVVVWWLQHRAKVRLQREVHSGLSAALGIGGDESTPAAELMSESDRLDLQLKSHKVARAIGDCVSFEAIRDVVTLLATDIRQACDSVNAATGRDVLPLFDEAFDRFEQSLADSAIQAGEASG